MRPPCGPDQPLRGSPSRARCRPTIPTDACFCSAVRPGETPIAASLDPRDRMAGPGESAREKRVIDRAVWEHLRTVEKMAVPGRSQRLRARWGSVSTDDEARASLQARRALF